MITVVTPYRNDPNLPRTIENVKKLKLKHIIVNDCGDDSVGDIKLSERLGVGGAIDAGVEKVKTKYFCILAADTIITKGHPRDMILGEKTLSCAINVGIVRRWGADILLKVTEDDLPPKSALRGKNYKNIIEAQWRAKQSDKIPCVLGACYVINTDWYRHLRGFYGHKLWGTLEPYLSLKSWLAGGDCRMTEVESDHIFGQAKNKVEPRYLLYNKLFIAKTVLPEWADDLDKFLGSNGSLTNAKRLIAESNGMIEKTRDYYQSIFTRTPEDIFEEFKLL